LNNFATKALSIFRDYAQKKRPLRGNRSTVYLVTQSIGVPPQADQEGESLNPETSYETTPFITKM